MPTPAPADERRHAHDHNALWNESYYFDWFQADGSLGGYIRIGLYPNLDTVWYWACVVGPDRELVTVVSHDVALPTSAASLEIRADGIWADHTVETPLDHMTCNLEAFGLEVSDPAEMYGDVRGTRLPFGFELDWETDRAAYLWPPVTPRYEIPCRVHGTVTVGNDTIEVDGWGQRDHSWGAARDWWAHTWCWSAGRLDDGTRFHTAGGFIPENDWGVGYVLAPGSDEFAEFDGRQHLIGPGARGHSPAGHGRLRSTRTRRRAAGVVAGAAGASRWSRGAVPTGDGAIHRHRRSQRPGMDRVQSAAGAGLGDVVGQVLARRLELGFRHRLAGSMRLSFTLANAAVTMSRSSRRSSGKRSRNWEVASATLAASSALEPMAPSEIVV